MWVNCDLNVLDSIIIITQMCIHQGTLYKRGFSAPLLKRIGKEDVNYVLREVHEGVCGNHIGAQTLAGKNPEARVLLAHDAQRRHENSQKVQNLS